MDFDVLVYVDIVEKCINTIVSWITAFQEDKYYQILIKITHGKL